MANRCRAKGTEEQVPCRTKHFFSIKRPDASSRGIMRARLHRRRGCARLNREGGMYLFRGRAFVTSAWLIQDKWRGSALITLRVLAATWTYPMRSLYIHGSSSASREISLREEVVVTCSRQGIKTDPGSYKGILKTPK